MTQLFIRKVSFKPDRHACVVPLDLDMQKRRLSEGENPLNPLVLRRHFGSELLRMLWPDYLPQRRNMPTKEQIFEFYNLALQKGEEMVADNVLVSPPVLSPHKLEYTESMGLLEDMGFLHPAVEYLEKVRKEMQDAGDSRYLDIPTGIGKFKHNLYVFENTVDFYVEDS